MRGYAVPVVIYVAAEDEEEAFLRVNKIANTMKGKHCHGFFIEDYPEMELIPVLGG